MHIDNMYIFISSDNLSKTSYLLAAILNAATRHWPRALMARKYSAKPGLSINDKKLSPTRPYDPHRPVSFLLSH